MNFFAVQSLNSYTKNMEMQMKWQKRKDTNDFTADGTTSIDDWVKQQADEIRQANKEGSAKLQAQIDLKLKCGQRLTADEMEYLRKNDPEAYQHVKSMQAEQKQYEQELKRCKTKDEVERVKMLHTASSLSAVNNIMHNSAIPENKKFELVMREHQKNEALQQSTREFVESGRYAKLPTEQERLKAEKDLQEAKEAEQKIDDPTQDTVEEILDKAAEGGDEGPQEASQVKEALIEDARDVLSQREMTRAEAELTPEALKVKRARAQAAYKAAGDIAPVPVLDVKAE